MDTRRVMSRHPHFIQGFSLVEMMLSIGAIILMSSLIIPAAMELAVKLKSRKVLTEIEEVAYHIDLYNQNNKAYPDSLSDVFKQIPVDPWSNPYQYLKIADESQKNNKVNNNLRRRKKNEDYLNTDYDLYSMGPDGESHPPLTAMASHDDIIRARNGKYFGVAAEF